MLYQATTATHKVLALRKRLRAIAGGTSASKTISIEQVLLDMAYSLPLEGNDVISIVSESIPHLKRGAMRDFQNMMQAHGYWRDSEWNKTDLIYTAPTGWKIEFFGADQPDKVRGPRRRILFLNEANNIPFETYNQLEVRTKDVIFLDWNPTNEFWFYTDVLTNHELKDDLDFITLTYKDNEALDSAIVKSIESRRHNKNWWKVYGLGELGDADQIIYHDWQIIDEIPHEARLLRRWLDYGYTNDPTAIGDIYEYNGGYILDEQLYQKGLSNKQIADFILALEHPGTLVKADSAEPKSNDEIKGYGVNLIPANKGQGSVNQGIQKVQEQRISVTSRSTNILKEKRNYMWETDKDGKILNVPIGIWNHHMDGIRYGFEDIVFIPTFKPIFTRILDNDLGL